MEDARQRKGGMLEISRGGEVRSSSIAVSVLLFRSFLLRHQRPWLIPLVWRWKTRGWQLLVRSVAGEGPSP